MLWTCRKTDYVMNLASIPLCYLILSFKVFLFIILYLYFLLTKRGESLYYCFAACFLRVHMGSSVCIIKYYTELDVNKKAVAPTVVLS